MSVDPRVQAFLDGDEQAGAALLGELLPRVRNLIRSLIGRDDEVDDVAQQVLMQVVRSLASYRGDGPLHSWVQRITVRTALAHARQRRARSVSEVPLETSEGDEIANLSRGPGWDSYLERRRAVELLDRLPVEQRSAVVLHHVLGLSVPEIAEEEGINFETVRSRLRLGMAKLRDWAEAPKAAAQ